MGFFIFTAILMGIGIAVAWFGFRTSKKNKADVEYRKRDQIFPAAAIGWVGIAIFALGFLLVLPRTFYTQDVGESKVQISWTGELIGQTTTPGIHLKAPWVNVRTFDVRNNLVAYVGTAGADGSLPNYSGNATTGPQITTQDREGVEVNLDVTVRYSLDPSSVLNIYSDFQTQEAFVNRVISEGVRTETRNAPSTKTTIQVFNDRASLAVNIRTGLEKRWDGLGIIIEEVSVQDIRYSNVVTERFDDAQAARIAIEKAKASQEAAKVDAETLVIKSQGEADAKIVFANGEAEANRILAESLTPEVLQQRYIDTLKTGTVFVVPEGSTPLITTGK